MESSVAGTRQITYDDEITRAFSIATVVWGLVALLLGAVVATQLVPESEDQREGRTYRIAHRIEGGRVVKDVVIEEEGLTMSYRESVRLYHHHDLIGLLKAAGLNPLAAYGGYDGRDFTTDAPRCILVARKP